MKYISLIKSFTHLSAVVLTTAGNSLCAANQSPYAIATAGSDMSNTNSAIYKYDSASNRLSNGMKNNSKQTISMGLISKPVEILHGLDKKAFKYAPNENRYMRTDADGSTTFYLANGSFEYRLTRSDNTVTPQAIAYVHTHEYSPAAQVDITNIDQIEHTFFLKDHLGSRMRLIDDAGNATQPKTARYDAWGSNVDVQGYTNQPLDKSDETTRGFTGHELLAGSNLIHMNGRIYDPQLAQFIGPDRHLYTENSAGGLNRFSYVNASPLNATDPTGWKIYFESVNAKTSMRAFIENIKTRYSEGYKDLDVTNDYLSKSKLTESDVNKFLKLSHAQNKEIIIKYLGYKKNTHDFELYEKKDGVRYRKKQFSIAINEPHLNFLNEKPFYHAYEKYETKHGFSQSSRLQARYATDLLLNEIKPYISISDAFTVHHTPPIPRAESYERLFGPRDSSVADTRNESEINFDNEHGESFFEDLRRTGEEIIDDACQNCIVQ